MAKRTFVVLMVVAMLAVMVPTMASAQEIELIGEWGRDCRLAVGGLE